MFAILDANGIPMVLSDKDQGGMTPVPPGVDGALCMLSVEGWVRRQAIAAPIVDEAGVMTFDEYPVGTLVEVIDTEDRVVLFEGAFDGVIDLPEPGSYQIEVKPPAPWIGWSGRLTRS